MRLFQSLAAAALLVAPAVVHADDSHDHSGHDQAQPKKEKKLCRTPATKTGTRMGATRVCKTAAEWAEIDKANATSTQLLGSKPLGTVVQGN